MNLHAILAAGQAATTTAQEQSAGNSALLMLIQFGPIVLIVVLMYFIMIRPQRKKQKEEQKMRNNMRVGDEITTIGGICGRVLNIKEDSLVIETGADRNKMTLKSGPFRPSIRSTIRTTSWMMTMTMMMTTID